jgi:hypothetical protein
MGREYPKKGWRELERLKLINKYLRVTLTNEKLWSMMGNKRNRKDKKKNILSKCDLSAWLI